MRKDAGLGYCQEGGKKGSSFYFDDCYDLTTMNKNRTLISLVLGFIAFGGQGVIGNLIPDSAYLQAIFGALLAVVAGGVRASAGGFFGGLLLAIACWFVPGMIIGTSYDRYKILIVGPLTLVWVLGVTGLAFFVGKGLFVKS